MSEREITPEFAAAVNAALADHERYGDVDSGDFTENGALRVVGISRADAVRMTATFMREFDSDNDLTSADRSTRAAIVLTIVEVALAAGVRLERARWEGAGT